MTETWEKLDIEWENFIAVIIRLEKTLDLSDLTFYDDLKGGKK